MVTLSLDFRYLQQLSSMPKHVQAKALQMVQKVMEDSTRAGLNLEKLSGFPDNIRTIRVDKQYRAVLVAPPKGNTFVLAWIDNHDEAMAWARNKRFEINDETGVLQFYNVEEAERALPAVEVEGKDEGVIAGLRDRELTRIGVPEPLLPAIRNIRTLDDLDAMKPHIPEEVWEALLHLLCGDRYDDIVRTVDQRRDEAERARKEQVARRERAARPVFGEGGALHAIATEAPATSGLDPDEEEAQRWERALAHPDTRRHVRAIASVDELEVMLERPFEQWRLFLHPDQSTLVERSWNGPVRVLGGAGTGKTVVALHRARYLAERLFRDPNDRILFTTYTTTLASEISRLLDELCTPEARRRIEVRNLHGWAAEWLKRQGVRVQVLQRETAEQLWEEAVTLAGPDFPFSVAFVRAEWEEVVQRHGLESERAYLLKPREGRGRRLSRLQRKQLWSVMAHFRQAREAGGWMEYADLVHEATRRLAEIAGEPPYRSVLVDEAQDFDEADFRLVAKLAGMRPERTEPDSLFLVGDPHQRIYNRRVRLLSCHIDIRGRGRKLRLNYRTTDRIRRWAIACLEGMTVDDLDGGNDNLHGYVSTRMGEAPHLRHFQRLEDETAWLDTSLRTLVDTHGLVPNEICICTRHNDAADHYARALTALGYPTVRLTKGAPPEADGVRVATMHRIKGLEFRGVLIAGLQGPLSTTASPEDDDTSRKATEDLARSLVYVAATRARDHLFVSGYGSQRSPLLEGAP